MATTLVVRTGSPKALDDTLRGLPMIYARVVEETWDPDQQTCHVRVQGDVGFFRYAMANQGYGDVLSEVTDEGTGGARL